MSFRSSHNDSISVNSTSSASSQIPLEKKTLKACWERVGGLPSDAGLRALQKNGLDAECIRQIVKPLLAMVEQRLHAQDKDISKNEQKPAAFEQLGADVSKKLHSAGLDLEEALCCTRAVRTACLDVLLEDTALDQKLLLFLVSTHRFFFDSFDHGFMLSWFQSIRSIYNKKLREANRFILHEKRRYYTVFNRMSEPAFIIDNDMRIVDTNRAFDQFFQVEGRLQTGKLCYEVLGKELCSSCALSDVLHNQKSFTGVETCIPAGGEEKQILLSGTFLGDINSEYSGGIIILQDISEQKRSEQALLESEEKYRSLIENVPDITWRADQDGKFVFVSQNISAILGYSAEKFIAEAPPFQYTLIHPDDLEMVRNEYSLFFASHLPAWGQLRDLLNDSEDSLEDAQTQKRKKSYDVRYRMRTRSGEWLWVHDRASHVYMKQGEWFTDGVMTDITELKKAEDELEKHHFRLAELVDERTAELKDANLQLKEEIRVRRETELELLNLAGKLKASNEELEHFAHTASHDLKEPLILITAFSDRLYDQFSDRLGERGRDYLVRIQRAAAQMQQLVDDLLELSRISTSQRPYEQIDLNVLMNEVISGIEQRLIKTGGKIEVGKLTTLHGDRIQLHQLFQNLFVNALKYCRKDVQPLIEVHSEWISDEVLEIIIQDNGIGFEEKFLEEIFKPFIRLHSRAKFEGTGIGLATCKKIVDRHGGEITATSQIGRGSSFIVRLPVFGKSENSDHLQ